MQKVLLSLVVLGFSVMACGQRKKTNVGVRWQPLQQVAATNIDKPILVDLYTDWCTWCKVMDKKTYSHPKVAAYINEKFIPIKLNAEAKAPFLFQGITYSFNAAYNVNEWALKASPQQLAFPTTVFVVPGSEPIAIPGYLTPKDIEPLLHYFGEKQFEKISYGEFVKTYRTSW